MILTIQTFEILIFFKITQANPTIWLILVRLLRILDCLNLIFNKFLNAIEIILLGYLISVLVSYSLELHGNLLLDIDRMDLYRNQIVLWPTLFSSLLRIGLPPFLNLVLFVRIMSNGILATDFHHDNRTPGQ